MVARVTEVQKKHTEEHPWTPIEDYLNGYVLRIVKMVVIERIDCLKGRRLENIFDNPPAARLQSIQIEIWSELYVKRDHR